MIDVPSDPLPRLWADAVAIHETFRALTDAGFTADQALTLLAKMVCGSHDEHPEGM